MPYSGTKVAFAGLLSMVFANAASAQGVVTTKQLSIDVANGIAMTALQECRKGGFHVSVAIVDRAGNVQVLLKDNGAGPHTPDTARRKAYTSASIGVSSADFAKRTEDPKNATLKDMTTVIALAGGLPIRARKDLIGGIGVGGTPSGARDEACANAGLQKYASELK